MASIGTNLNKKKDAELIKFIEEMNNIGYTNSILVRIGLYKVMNEFKGRNVPTMVAAPTDIENSNNITDSSIDEETTDTNETVEYNETNDTVENTEVDENFNDNDESEEALEIDEDSSEEVVEEEIDANKQRAIELANKFKVQLNKK